MKKLILNFAFVGFAGIFLSNKINAQNVGDLEFSNPINPQKSLDENYDGYDEAGSCRNLIKNPSFEFYEPLSNPNSPAACYSTLNRVYGWENVKLNTTGFYHAGTPDLYYTGQPVSGSNSPCEHCAVTIGDYAVEPVSTPPGWGNTSQAYAGVGLYYKRPGVSISPDEEVAREYAIVGMRETLRPGVTYNISMRVSLGEVSLYALPLQVYFTQSQNFNVALSGYNASHLALNNGTGGLVTFSQTVTSKSGWTTINAQITPPAGSSYKYMVIGNFRDNTQTEAAYTNVSATTPGNGYNGLEEWSSYYLIDDVEVSADCPAQVYLGGCNTQGFFDLNGVPADPEPLSSLTSLLTPSVQSVFIDYPILVDIDYTISGKDVTFGPFGKLIVPNSKTLTVTNSVLHGCKELWPGIEVKPGGSIFMTNSTLRDAYTGVSTDNALAFTFQGNLFQKNKKHLVISNHSSTLTRSVFNNEFSCTANLLYPLEDEITGDAVSYINCIPAMIFGSAGSQQGNLITKADRGLILTGTRAEVYKNSFYELNMAIEAAHNGTGADYRLVAVGSSNSAYGNTIDGCYNGISLRRNLKSIVTGNVIKNIEATAIGGYDGNTAAFVNTTSATEVNYSIVGNRIFNARNGVYLYNNGNAGIQIKNNLIERSIGTAMENSLGIYVGEKMNMKGGCRYWTPAPNFTREKLINENVVKRYGRGILTDNSTCLWITKNLVEQAAPTSQQHHGIWYRNDRLAFVYANTVQGNRLGWQTIGIRAENTRESECGCNNINRNGYAQVNAGWNTLTKVYRNKINTAEQGITAWGGGVGTQTVNVNGPVGTMNEWSNMQIVGSQPRHFWAAGQTQQNHTLFYLPAGISVHNPLAISLGGNFINIQSITALTPYRGCQGSGQSAMVSVSDVEEEIKKGIKPEPGGQLLEYNLLLVSLIEENNWADSSLAISDFVTDNANALTIYKAGSFLQNDECDKAISELANLNNPDEFEILYSDWLTVLANMCLNESLPDGQDSLFLTETAALCPLEYGTPVYSARAIVFNLYGVDFEYSETCGLIRDENPGSIEEEPLPAPDLFIISPNPASGMVNINNTSGNMALYSVKHQSGTELLTGTVNTGNTSVNTSALMPGIYYVYFMDMLTGSIIETDVLIIL